MFIGIHISRKRYVAQHTSSVDQQQTLTVGDPATVKGGQINKEGLVLQIAVDDILRKRGGRERLKYMTHVSPACTTYEAEQKCPYLPDFENM